MDRFIGGFIGSDDDCLVYDHAGNNRIYGIYHQIKARELQLILATLNNPVFSVPAPMLGKVLVNCACAGKQSIFMVHHSIGSFV